MGRTRGAVLALALAVGCTDAAAPGARITNVSKPLPGSGAETVMATDPRIALLGAAPGGVAPETVAASIVLPAEVGPRRPVLVAADDPRGRVVLGFGRVSAADLCAGRAAPGGTATLVVSGAFCTGPEPASYGILTQAGVTSAADPGFAPAIRSLLREILTPVRQGGAPR